MANLVTLTVPPLNGGGREGAFTRVQRWLALAADNILGPTEAQAQRVDVIRRAIVAGTIIAILPIQQMQIPGWPAVMGACVVALSYDVLLAWLVFAKKRYFMANVLGLSLDALILMGASFYVFREMGAAGATSSIWLVFLIYIVIGGFTLAPLGSLAYTAIWTSWFALATLMYFSAGTLYYDDLPIRLIFMALIGLVSLGMANELQKKRTKLEQQNRQTMGMLATLVEARDTDAGAHLHSIQEFSIALARRLGFSEKDAREIAYASMMHDVGKANVPDSVLKKPGKLTAEERRIMRDHTAWGDQLLSENDDFELARVVARSHHEHWDGSGYPDGLSGPDIPLVARIVAVADIYDALISKRPYKEAWTQLEAIREIERIAGSDLDPQIAGAFIALWHDGTIKRIEDSPPDIEHQQAA
ncbi:MAG: HD domain-containing protein [Chloroflexi bacterium]|nr:HD domain-containing protein [Chloroflexota bacterium]